MAILSTIQQLVRNLTLERFGDTGLITDSELTEIINVASRVLFIRIASRWGEALAQRSAVNVNVASTGIMGFAAFAPGATVVKVLDIRAGAVAATESAMRTVRPFNKIQQKGIYEGTTAAVPSRYFIEGTNVIFAPLPTGAFDARVSWVQMPTDVSAGGDTLWGGKLSEHHDAIAILASIMVLNKDGRGDAPFVPVFEYVEKVLTDRFGPPGPYDIVEPENGRP